MTFIKYAVYILVLACAVMFVRKQTAPKLEFHVGGYVKPGFEAVDEAFRELMKTHMIGGAFSAYYQGEPVVDLWGGYADVDSKQFWEKDTISLAFSTTKAIAAMCVGVLVTRGHVRYDDPVSKFWPEFAAKGKEKVTLRMLLNHEAGLAALDKPLTLEELVKDSPSVSKALAEQKPFWEPGTGQGYHSVTFGLYIDQVVRRVDPKKRNVTQFFEDEIAQPLGVDFSLHLKKSERYRDTRVIDLTAYGLTDAIWNGFETWDFRMARVFYEIMTDADSLSSKAGFSIILPESSNNIHKKTVEVSSFTGHGTARAIAKLFGMVAMDGAMVDGKPLISDNVLLEFIQVPDEIPVDKVMKFPVSFSAGMAHFPTPAGDWMFGMPGLGGQMGFGDPKKEIGLGLLTNHLMIYVVPTDPRVQNLFRAVYSSVKKIESEK